MALNEQLGLRISGTKQRQGGFAHLVAVGVLAGNEGDNMDRAPQLVGDTSFIIKHAQDYTLYLLLDGHAKPSDSDGTGILSIALTIPKGKQLANGASPYTLLMDVYGLFVNNYMVATLDGNHRFKNDAINDEGFRDVVKRYLPLEVKRSAHIVMNPIGVSGFVSVPKEKLEEFFSNTQYNEFASFKDIEVGIDCPENSARATESLSKLQIPLPTVRYDIWVNGQQTGSSLAARDDEYTTNERSTNIEYYSYNQVTFTLGELLDAMDNRIKRDGASISLDLRRNRIDCFLEKDYVYYDINLEFRDNVGGKEQDINNYILTKAVKIRCGSLPLLNGLTNIRLEEFDRAGRHITLETTEAVKKSLDLQCATRIDDERCRVNIIITINAPKPIPKPTPRPMPSSTPAPKPIPTPHPDDDEDILPPMPAPQRRIRFHWKEFVLGVIIGFIMSSLAMVVYKKIVPEPEPTPIDATITPQDTDSVPRDNILGVVDSSPVSQDSTIDIPAQAGDEQGVAAPSTIEDDKRKQAELKKQAREEMKAARGNIVKAVNKKQQPSGEDLAKAELSDDQKAAIQIVLKDYSKDSTLGQPAKTQISGIQRRRFKNIKSIVDAGNEINNVIQRQ